MRGELNSGGEKKFIGTSFMGVPGVGRAVANVARRGANIAAMRMKCISKMFRRAASLALE